MNRNCISFILLPYSNSMLNSSSTMFQFPAINSWMFLSGLFISSSFCLHVIINLQSWYIETSTPISQESWWCHNDGCCWSFAASVITKNHIYEKQINVDKDLKEYSWYSCMSVGINLQTNLSKILSSSNYSSISLSSDAKNYKTTLGLLYICV